MFSRTNRLGGSNVWGSGGLFEERMGLRNDLLRQELGQPSNAPAANFGGVSFGAGETEGRAEAIGLRNMAQAESDAQLKMRRENGSPDLQMNYAPATPGEAVALGAGTAAGGEPSPATPPSQTPFGQSVQQGGVEGYMDMVTNDLGLTPSSAPVGNTPAPVGNTGLRSGHRTSGRGIGGDPSKSGLKRLSLSNPSALSTSGSMTGPVGRRYAQNKVNQPGFRSGGKVSMRGYATGGTVGAVSKDNGKDVVDAQMRHGEYVVTPEGLEVLGGENGYEGGVALLDQANEMGTGEKPGAIPVNEAGEAVRGFRNGGSCTTKPGFALGGGQIDMFGNPKQPNMGTYAGSAGPPTPSAEELRQGKYQNFGRQAGEKFRNSGVYQTGAKVKGIALPKQGWKAPAAVTPVITGGITLADNMSGAKDAYYNDPDVEAWEKFKLMSGEISSFALPTAGAVVGGAGGGVVSGGLGTAAGGVGGFTAGALADRGLRTAFGAPASGTEEFNEYAANWQPPGAAQQEEAPPQPAADPNAYRQAFTNAPADLRDMNVVMNTGGPGNEVITREDRVGPNGEIIPSFTNLRQAGPDGQMPFGNLQQEANQRAAEDAAAAELRGQRRLGSGALMEAGHMEEAIEMRKTELGAASKAKPAKKADLDKLVKERSQRPQFDDEGNVSGYMEDPEWERDFYDAMVGYKEATGIDIYDMEKPELDALMKSFDDVRTDTLLALQMAQRSGEPTSDIPRSGENGLRVLEGSDISLGDVWGPEATIGDYWAGAFDNNAINDRMVIDPRTKARTPLRRALRAHPSDTQGALKRWNYDGGQ